MFEKLKDLHVTDRLPVLGILAFSAASIHSVNQLLQSRANHPTPLYTLAACLIELTTAWLVYSVVEQLRAVTKSRISKQDRRFALGVFVAFTVLAIPSLVTSVVANALEFNDLLLGLLFPGLSVACAVGMALPETVQRHDAEKQREKTDRKERARVRQREAEHRQMEAQREAGRQQREAQAAAEKDRAQAELQQGLDRLGAKARQILGILASGDGQSQAEVAQRLNVKRQTVAHHYTRLETLGLIRRNGKGVELLVELPEGFAGDNGSG